MKKIFLATLVASAALLSACNGSSSSKKAEFKTNADSIAYATGVGYGAQTIGNLENLKQGLLQSGSDSTAVEDFIRGLQDGFKSAEDKKKIAYYLGASMGVNIRTNMAKNLDYIFYGENDSVNHVDPSNIIVGFVDCIKNQIALKDKDGKAMTPDAVMAYVQEASTKVYNDRMSKQYTKEIKAEKDYFAKLAKEEGIKPLKNGVYYKEIKAGSGATPKQGQYANIEYTGKLVNGTEFDKSEQATKFPVGVGFVVPGFDAALMAMPAGAEWEVYIPSDQGYGAQTKGNITPFSTLIFTIKVLSIEDAPQQPQAQAQPQVQVAQ